MSTLPLTAAARCARCRGVEVLFTPEGDRALATVCECVSRCQQCGGSGRVTRQENGSLFASPCSCRSRQKRVEIYNRARIPRHFCGKGFESFRAYEPAHEAALSRVQAFAQGYPKFGKGVLLHGPTGTGKTHLLCAALQHLTLERGVAARYVEFSFLVSEIKEAFARNVSALVALAPLADAEVLAIDELGKGRATEFERDTLDELISRRYNADKITLFATNFSATPPKRTEAPGPIGAAFVSTSQLLGQGLSDQHLKDRVGDRTYSRLAEMAEFVPVLARDRRVPPG